MTIKSDMPSAAGNSPDNSDRPNRARLILLVLITGAVVANVNLSIGNVAIPEIGRELKASASALNVVAAAFMLGLAATVLYFGAISDRYGRKKLLLLGALLTIPTSVAAALAPSLEILVIARLSGGIAAGLLLPATLAIISVMWRGVAQTKAMALWAGIGAGCISLMTVLGGFFMQATWWGSVFLLTVPLAVAVLAIGWFVIPGNAGETTSSIDHRSGALSILAIGFFVFGLLAIGNSFDLVNGGILAIGLVLGAAFFVRQLRIPNPLLDLRAMKVPTFWIATVAGTVGLGGMIGTLFLGQQFLQDVLGYSALDAALCTLPSGVALIGVAPLAGKLLVKLGTRAVLLLGSLILTTSFTVILFLWGLGTSVAVVLLAYLLLGAGVSFLGSATTHSLMASLPRRRSGMGSAVIDLTRDLGGAVIQAAMGVALVISYSGHVTANIGALNFSPDQTSEDQITSGFNGAELASGALPPEHAATVIGLATSAFVDGKNAAVSFALVLVIGAIILVAAKYPGRVQEREFMARAQSPSA